MRNAMIAAASLEIVCRDCGECIVNDVMDTDGVFINSKADGSTIWTIEQVQKASGRKIVCPSCDEPMKIIMDSKAHVSAAPTPQEEPHEES